MAKYYLVKQVSTATPENPNFAGAVHTSYYGKGDTIIASDDPYINRPLNEWWVKEYAYTRLCDAKRNWTFNHPENTKYWTSTVEIEEVE